MTKTSNEYYRIVSLDGGATILNALRCLLLVEENVLEAQGESVLARADMFTGTSAGAVSALYLASRDWDAMEREFGPRSGIIALHGCIRLLEDIMLAMPGQMRRARAFFGLGSLYDYDFLADLVSQDNRLGRLTMGDITQRRIVVPAFRVRHRIWYDFPKAPPDGAENIQPTVTVYHNRDVPENPYLDIPLVDVGLRSGAFPMIFPIWDGEIDGGVYANNPAVLGMMWRDARGSGPEKLDEEQMAARLQQIQRTVVLSAGSRSVQFGDRWVQDELRTKAVPWGGMAWLFNFFAKAMAMSNVVVDSNTNYANIQGVHLLGDRFIRIAANTKRGLVDSYVNVIRGKPELVIEEAKQAANEWLESESGQVHGCSPNDVLNVLARYHWISDV